jgi:hypothetical protein
VNAQKSYLQSVAPFFWTASLQPNIIGQLINISDDFGNFVREQADLNKLAILTDSPDLTVEMSWYSTNWYVTLAATSVRSGNYKSQLSYTAASGEKETIRAKRAGDGHLRDMLEIEVRPRAPQKYSCTGTEPKCQMPVRH